MPLSCQAGASLSDVHTRTGKTTMEQEESPKGKPKISASTFTRLTTIKPKQKPVRTHTAASRLISPGQWQCTDSVWTQTGVLSACFCLSKAKAPISVDVSISLRPSLPLLVDAPCFIRPCFVLRAWIPLTVKMITVL